MISLRTSGILVLFLFIQAWSIAQYVPDKHGKWFIYWGWNRGAFSKSDIHFQGVQYDFTLEDVIAKDRQTKFNPATYLNPVWATIPQYNFRLGYFLHPNYSLSFGADHMKYVVQQGQTVSISGEIRETVTEYNGIYADEPILIQKDFLKFEHTDGLNYANLELRRHDEFYSWKKLRLSLVEGIGAGILLPKTNTTLMGAERYDEFHLSGYGIGAVVGVTAEIGRTFFIQSEWKGGFISMPDIRTSIYELDRAQQHFYFTQINIVFGAVFDLLDLRKVRPSNIPYPFSRPTERLGAEKPVRLPPEANSWLSSNFIFRSHHRRGFPQNGVGRVEAVSPTAH